MVSKIAGNRNFTWQWVPPLGRSGGILLGADLDLFDLIEHECGKHFIRMLLRDKNSKLKWHLVVIYGPAQTEKKESFLVELAYICNKCTGACLFGGDFNIIRKTEEKNKPCVLSKWSHLFNSIIDINGLKELSLNGRK